MVGQGDVSYWLLPSLTTSLHDLMHFEPCKCWWFASNTPLHLPKIELLHFNDWVMMHRPTGVDGGRHFFRYLGAPSCHLNQLISFLSHFFGKPIENRITTMPCSWTLESCHKISVSRGQVSTEEILPRANARDKTGMEKFPLTSIVRCSRAGWASEN